MFSGAKKNFKFFWKHYSVRTEKLHNTLFIKKIWIFFDPENMKKHTFFRAKNLSVNTWRSGLDICSLICAWDLCNFSTYILFQNFPIFSSWSRIKLTFYHHCATDVPTHPSEVRVNPSFLEVFNNVQFLQFHAAANATLWLFYSELLWLLTFSNGDIGIFLIFLNVKAQTLNS